MRDSYPDFDDPEFPTCDICGAEMDRECCWQCHGEGGWHDCGECCCACLHPENNERCEECHGEGAYWVCGALPHSDEQMRAYEMRKAAQR